MWITERTEEMGEYMEKIADLCLPGYAGGPVGTWRFDVLGSRRGGFGCEEVAKRRDLIGIWTELWCGTWAEQRS